MSNDFWKYFEKQFDNDAEKRAECTLCGKLYSYTNASNLLCHLALQHPDESSQLEPSTPVKLNKAKFDTVWDAFTRTDPKQRIARCKFCNKVFSFKSTVTNLKVHGARMHGINFAKPQDENELFETDETDSESGDDLPPSARAVSHFFVRKTRLRAQCSICLAAVPRTVQKLRAHLKEKHPKLLVEDADNQGSDAFTEVVYLEECLDNDPDEDASHSTKDEIDYFEVETEDGELIAEEIRPEQLDEDVLQECKDQVTKAHEDSKKKLKEKAYIQKIRKKTREEKTKRRTSHVTDVFNKTRDSSTDTSNKNSDNDELQVTGRYIKLILKSLPRNTRMKLQRDFLQSIMNANIGDEETDKSIIQTTSVQSLPIIHPAPGEVCHMIPTESDTVSSDKSSSIAPTPVTSEARTISITIGPNGEVVGML